MAGLKATAERQGDHYVLNGQKKWITWAVHADVSDKRKARQDKTRQDKTRQDKDKDKDKDKDNTTHNTTQDKARQDKTRQDETRQGERSGKAR